MGLVQDFRSRLNLVKDERELAKTLKELQPYIDGEKEVDKDFKKLSLHAADYTSRIAQNKYSGDKKK